MADKEFKTIDEQIDILRCRGLDIPDEEQARKFLTENNYYRVSGYSLTLRSHDKFYKHATFQNIIDIYNFDHELRHLLLKYLEKIEVMFKSIFSYHFTKKYGAIGYLNRDNFTNAEKYDEIIKKAEGQKISRLPHEAYLKHFVEDLKQDIPFWAYVDLLTIHDISVLYSITDFQTQIDVASTIGIMKQGDKILNSFMHGMTIIRNLCAHGSRLYNRLFEQKPWLNKKELSLLRRDEGNVVDNAHLFGYILVIRRLISLEDFSTLKDELNDLSNKYIFVDMSHYGFPDNWKKSL